MWYPSVITTQPEFEPITAAQVKAQCSIASADTSRDDLIAILIPAARQAVQTYCGIRLMTQTVSVFCDCFADFARVPEAPLSEVLSVKYIDTDGVEQTLDSSVYAVRNEGLSPSIVLNHGQTWPSIQSGSRIEVAAECGYEMVPADIVYALLLTVTKLMSFARADMLKRREAVDGIGETQWGGVVEISSALDDTVCNLLESYRTWPLA